MASSIDVTEHKALNKKKDKDDYFLNKKPVLDEYQVEEFENNIHYAMEYQLPISFRLHNEGNPIELHVHGYCVYIDPVTKELSIQKKDSSFEKIKFNEIISVVFRIKKTLLLIEGLLNFLFRLS